jgi:ribose-phosphate pyrophosphokinase
MTLLRHPRRIALLTGNSHHRLADDVANRLGIALTPCNVGKFSALETSVQINSSVRDEDVFILQSPSPPDINDHLMELLILVSGESSKRWDAPWPGLGD